MTVIRRNLHLGSVQQVPETWRTFLQLAVGCILLFAQGTHACFGQSKSPKIPARVGKTYAPMNSMNKACSYKSCLQVMIKRITPHTAYMYHSDKAQIDVVVLIEDVLKSGLAIGAPNPKNTGLVNGATVTFVLDKPDLIPADAVGAGRVWALNWWRIQPGFYHITDLFDPFLDREFDAGDIQNLRQIFNHTAK